jgi:hypothetical protein
MKFKRLELQLCHETVDKQNLKVRITIMSWNSR